jgi:hypothetical protein
VRIVFDSSKTWCYGVLRVSYTVFVNAYFLAIYPELSNGHNEANTISKK